MLLEMALRVLPILGFLLAITVVAEIADLAGVFDAAARRLARWGGGRVVTLWLLCCALAAAATALLSLDTTAVLLTPVMIALARRLEVSPWPFVMATVWLANTASLFLPVSNLTNLLALHRLRALGLGTWGYLGLMAGPGAAAVVVSVAVIFVFHRRELRGRYVAGDDPPAPDRILLAGSAVVCALLGPAFVSGVAPVIPAALAALLLAALTRWRAPEKLARVSLPWAMTLGVAALFAVVGLAQEWGWLRWLAPVVGAGEHPAALWRVAAAGFVAANGVNNLPAYLLLEGVAGDTPRRLAALLIAVNCGPMVTIWASLANLLWRERCRRGGLEISLARFSGQSAVCAVAAVAAAVGVLAWVG